MPSDSGISSFGAVSGSADSVGPDAAVDSASAAATADVDTPLQIAQDVDLSQVQASLDAVRDFVSDLASTVEHQSDALQTLLAGVATVQVYTVFALLVIAGLLAALILAVALRRL